MTWDCIRDDAYVLRTVPAMEVTMIVCDPTSGLTSRIYVLADAYALAKKYGQELIIIWQKTSDCDISYHDVFEANQFADIPCKVYECSRFGEKLQDLKKDHTPGGMVRILKELGTRADFTLRYGTLTRYYKARCPVHKNSYEDDNALFEEEKAKGQSCYFEAYNCITGRGDLRSIRFRQSYVEEAAQILGEKRAHCIGVHIRRTDHGPATAGSPTERFVERMKKAIAEDPNACFFLATDDWEEQRHMEEIFGERILSQPGKVLSRSSKEGMHSSVIDTLCLSQTRYILGSYASIFSKFSAAYGGIELRIV